jgi:hypothetical protein
VFERKKVDLGHLFEEDNRVQTKRGPVGELPMHTCFLFGFDELGKEIVEKYYSAWEDPAPEDALPNINTPYRSDLAFWKETGFLDENDPNDDGGWYTGETCLHIAIVKVRMHPVCTTYTQRTAFDDGKTA